MNLRLWNNCLKVEFFHEMGYNTFICEVIIGDNPRVNKGIAPFMGNVRT